MKVEFDLLTDTLLHMREVDENMQKVIGELQQRASSHDNTKLQETEFDAFLTTREDFKKASYGTPEYQKCIDAIKPAIDHHYKHNRHHTQHTEKGVNGMTLIDLIEMLADWKAAERRAANKQTLEDTFSKACEKYGIKPQLAHILQNTLLSLGWIEYGCDIDYSQEENEEKR